MNPENQAQTPSNPEETPPVVPAPEAVTPLIPAVTNPGHSFGIASLITALVGFGPVGIILGIIGLKKSKSAGHKNGLALAGLIAGIVTTILAIVFIVSLSVASVAYYNSFLQGCKDMIPGSNPSVASVNGELKCSYPTSE